MFNCDAKTLGAPVRFAGVGLHSGAACEVELRPAHSGGLRFLHRGRTLPVHISQASAPGGSTLLGGQLDTPEHLLAALVGLGITELEIAVTGPEIPGLDGSARDWVQGLGELVCVGSTAGLEVSEPVEIEGFGGIARAWPGDRLELAVEVDFGPACRGRFELVMSPERFHEELCWARTFLPHRMLGAVHAAGRGRGAKPGSVVVLGERGPLVPVRSADECVRHKALDLLGDLALFGAPVRGRFELVRGTHALHQALVREVLGV